MSEQRRQDPANTQMFRAFVERGEEPKKSNRPVIIGASAAAVAVVVLIVLAVVLL